MDLQALIRQIDALKAEIDSLRPLDHEREARVMQKFRLDWNYHSSNIEGNSLTYGETKTFLLHGLTASGKPLKDHLEIKGHNEAILGLEDIVKGERQLTEHEIRSLHQVILGEPYQSPAQTTDGILTQRWITPGQYKIQPNHVRTATGETFYFATPEETPAAMEQLLSWYREAIADPALHPLIVAAMLHYKFIRIHPFDDGNGRIARILMNLVLMMNGYPPAIIRTEDKENYCRSLRQADGGDEAAFVIYIGEQLVRSMELFIKGARGEDVEEQDDIDKKIALFKAQLNNSDDESQYVRRSEDVVHDIVAASIIPLFETVMRKMKSFDDLFLDREFKLRPSKRSAYKSSDEVIAELKMMHLPIREVLILTLRWKGFIRSGIDPFDLDATLIIAFNELEYTVRGGVMRRGTISKRYPQVLSKEEQVMVANSLAEEALIRIKQKVDQAPS